MDDFEKYFNTQLENPEFKKEWDALEEEYRQIRLELKNENTPSPKFFKSFNVAPPVVNF